MLQHLLEFLKEQDVEFKIGLSLSQLSSIKIGGRATAVLPKTEKELITVVDYLINNGIRYKIIGRMTNILPCDEDYDGVLIITAGLCDYRIKSNTALAEAGLPFSKLLSLLSSKGLGGAESLYGIPGSLGGMIRSNAGAFGASVSDRIVRVRAYDVKSGTIKVYSREELDFSYRHSLFSDSDEIILSAELFFDFKNEELVNAGFAHYMNKRRSLQPYGEPSLGSVFKRHHSAPVSYLIDQLGMKGLRVGGAEISQKHAGFIVNKGNATASDVIRLIELIKNRLYREYGIIPEEEIDFLKKEE